MPQRVASAMSFNSRSPDRPGNTRSLPFRLRNWRAGSRTATASGLLDGAIHSNDDDFGHSSTPSQTAGHSREVTRRSQPSLWLRWAPRLTALTVSGRIVEWRPATVVPDLKPRRSGRRGLLAVFFTTRRCPGFPVCLPWLSLPIRSRRGRCGSGRGNGRSVPRRSDPGRHRVRQGSRASRRAP